MSEQWTWTYEGADGSPMTGDALSETAFPTQSDAESWFGEVWEDLAEVRTLAVRPSFSSRGVGSALLSALIEDARVLEVGRIFCLTFESRFFGRHGFVPIEGQAVSPEVYAELLRSYDDGIAEFLDLERVKPNTLGNTRMLLTLG